MQGDHIISIIDRPVGVERQRRIKRHGRIAKQALSNLLSTSLNIAADPDALFDVQIKRIHEYKRQLLNI
ncbi:MAG: glycogen/starch/alpha-glucan phosphorylase, partial [Bradyrhizobium icense]